MKVKVVEFDPGWLDEFNAEKVILNRCLSDLMVDIHHIGSTSVPGLAAKPIIDIIIEVYSLGDLDKLTPVMNSHGYEAKGEFGIPGRRYFVKGGCNRSHQIHAFKIGDENIIRHTAFRDYLKQHPVISQEYADLKKGLANSCNNDIECYCDGKNEFIKRHELEAIQWLNLGRLKSKRVK